MKKHYIFAALAILLWSLMSTVAKLLLGTLDSFQLLCISSLFAALGLFAVVLLTGRLKSFGRYKARDYLRMTLIGLPGTLVYYVFFYTGTGMMAASQAFIVNYLWPIMSVVFACIILKERVTPMKLVAILLSFLGVIIVVGEELLSFESGTLLGALFCALGAVSYGIFTALSQKYNYDKYISMMLAYGATFLLTGAYSLGAGGFPSVGWVELVGIAFNGAVLMGLANTLWALALGAGDTAKISNLAYITPFLSLIWNSIFLEEKIGVGSVVGLGVIMLGIFAPLIYEKILKKKGRATWEVGAKGES